jgi:hypothetical protein
MGRVHAAAPWSTEAGLGHGSPNVVIIGAHAFHHCTRHHLTRRLACTGTAEQRRAGISAYMTVEPTAVIRNAFSGLGFTRLWDVRYAQSLGGPAMIAQASTIH